MRSAKQGHDRLSPIADRRGAPVLSVRGLRLRPDGAPIDLEFKAGELIGLAGLEGHGGNTFLEALRGGIQTDGRGRAPPRRRPRGGHPHARPTPPTSEIAYVPRERRLDSVFSWMSIRENFALPTLDRDTRFGWLRPRASRKRLRGYVDRLGIVLGSPERLDHDALGRQPAEGRSSPAGSRSARACCC